LSLILILILKSVANTGPGDYSEVRTTCIFNMLCQSARVRIECMFFQGDRVFSVTYILHAGETRK